LGPGAKDAVDAREDTLWELARPGGEAELEGGGLSEEMFRLENLLNSAKRQV
jgi:hypothetical protein